MGEELTLNRTSTTNDNHSDLCIKHGATKINRMVFCFVLTDLALQAAKYASFSCSHEFTQAPLGLLLLFCIGVFAICISYFVFRKLKPAEKANNYRLFIVCLILAAGTTIISSEWSPWRFSGVSLESASSEISRFLQIKHVELTILTLKFIQFGGPLRLAVILYLIPSTYLVLRYETFGLNSLEFLVIPVLVLVTLCRRTQRLAPQKRASKDGLKPIDLESPDLDKSGSGLITQPLFESQVLLNALPEGAIVLDECGSPIQMNDAILKIFECPASEIVEKVFKLTDKDVAIQKSSKQQSLKRADTVFESYSDFSDIAALDCTIMNSAKPSPSQGKESAVKHTFLDLPVTKLEFGNPSPTILIRKPISSASDALKRPPLNLISKRRASVREEAHPPTLKFLGVPVQELPGESSATSSKIQSPMNFASIVKGNLLNHETINIKIQGPPEETSKSKPTEPLSFNFIPSKLAMDAEGRTKSKSVSYKRLVGGRNGFGGEAHLGISRTASDHKPQSQDSQEVIEQIAEEQAMSMKPHIDDFLERLSSRNIRSTYETVSEAIEHTLRKNFMTSLDLTIYKSNKEIPPKIGESPECVRSRSDGVGQYLLAKRGFLPPNSSIALNSFLKISSTKVKYLEIKISPFIHAGQKRLIILVRDDTQRDIARRLHLLDKQKASTLASTVHDLRAPLSVIISSIECLSSQLTDPQLLSSFLKPASSAAKSLMFLINDILDMHQISMKKLKLSVQRCDLQQTLGAVVDIFKLKAEIKGLQLHLKMSEGAPQKIMTDPNRLQQIVINLLSNALKFTEKGSISVEVKEVSAGRMKVSVIDTGIGIRQEDLGKLFEAFGRIRNKETDRLNPQGIGLGLNTSNKLSKMLCEDEEASGLRVESVFGRGTVFYFMIEDLENCNDTPQSKDSKYELTTGISPIPVKEIKHRLNSINFPHKNPYVRVDEPRSHAHSTQLQTREPERKACTCSKVLIVDDNEFNILSTVNILRSVNIQAVETAKNGKEAVEIIIKKHEQSKCCNKFDLILMDCQMPIMDGIVASTEIQRLTKAKLLAPQRIVGLSGFSSSDFETKCKKAGMSKVLVKPLTQLDVKSLMIR